MMNVIANELYRHYKGSTYRVVTMAKMENNGEMMVVYQATQYPNDTWVTPYSRFTEVLENGTPRFTELKFDK